MSEEYDEIEDEEVEDDLDRGDAVEDEDLEEDEEDEEDDSEDVSRDLEDDDSEDSEEDEESEEDEGEEDDTPETDIQIPKARLDEVIAQREAQKDRVQWLEDQLETLINHKQAPVAPKEDAAPKESYDFTKAEEDYASFLIDGETAKAAALRNTIDGERKAEFADMIKTIKSESITEATNKSSEAIEQDKFDALIGNFENKHTFLDADSDDYNEEAVDTINTLLSGYMASGKTKSAALKLSVQKVIPMYTTPEAPKKQGLGETRKTKARRKAAKASNAQPSKTASKGVKDSNPEAIDVGKMTERAYNKLTAKEKRVLRGD